MFNLFTIVYFLLCVDFSYLIQAFLKHSQFVAYIWAIFKLQACVYFCEDVNLKQQMAWCVYKPEAVITTWDNFNTKELSKY